MGGNNFGSLQTAIVDHISHLVDDTEKRESVKSGLNELLNVFKLEFNQVKLDILKEVNGRLKEKGMAPISLPGRSEENTYEKNDMVDNNNNDDHIEEVEIKTTTEINNTNNETTTPVQNNNDEINMQDLF